MTMYSGGLAKGWSLPRNGANKGVSSNNCPVSFVWLTCMASLCHFWRVPCRLQWTRWYLSSCPCSGNLWHSERLNAKFGTLIFSFLYCFTFSFKRWHFLFGLVKLYLNSYFSWNLQIGNIHSLVLVESCKAGLHRPSSTQTEKGKTFKKC